MTALPCQLAVTCDDRVESEQKSTASLATGLKKCGVINGFEL